MRRRKLLLGLATCLAVAISVSAHSFASEQRADQFQRDLTRVFSELYQRALSYDQLGEVARPEFASPKIKVASDTIDEILSPSCELAIEATASDPRRNLQALVFVPRESVTPDGTSFRAVSIYSGAPIITSELLNDAPAWLVAEAGGYDALAEDLALIASRSEIKITSLECPDFTISTIEGTAK